MMKRAFHLLLLSMLFSAGASKPAADAYAQGYGYTYNPAASGQVSPFVATSADLLNSQFQAQDESGQYNYGYSNPLSSKQESKTADGVVRGTYSYIDANGKIQSVAYISDVLGFRSSASVSPSPSIGYTQAAIQAVPAASVALAAPQLLQQQQTAIAPSIAYSYLPYATAFGYSYNPYPAAPAAAAPAEPIAVAPVAVAPVPQQQPYLTPAAAPALVAEAPVAVAAAPVAVAAAAPVAVPAPALQPYVTQTQYHAQDESGQYQFGYSDPNSARREIKTADGVVQGAYNYVDDQGKIQTVEYIADELGFRTVGTNVPVQTYQLQLPVQDTPEVAAARAEHERIFAETRARDEELESLQQQAEDKVVVPVLPTEEEGEGDEEEVLQYAAAPPAVVAPLAAPAGVVAEVPAVPAIAVVPAPAVAAAAATQFHGQDEIGQYRYGYSNADSAKVEQRLADGTVQGQYQYVDPEGKIQSVQYISDVLGFRVAGTNLPGHNVGGEVALTPQVQYSHLPYATNYGYNLVAAAEASAAPAPEVPAAAVAPAVIASPVAAAPAPVAVAGTISTQYQAQDEAGQYNYGYANPLSAKQESKTADGVVKGSYSYIDANGILQTTSYVSDALGFRAAGTNIPKGENDEALLKANVDYAYLPYAVNSPYYFY